MNETRCTTTGAGQDRGPRRAITAPALVAVLLAVVAPLLALGAAPATAASSAPAAAKDSGYVRAGHLAPSTGSVDIALTPLSGGRTTVLRDIAFEDITKYARVPTGTYSVAFRTAGSSMKSQPMIRKSIQVGDQSATTVLATGSKNDVTAQVVYDDLTPPPSGKAKIRLVSGTQDPVTARISGGPTLARDVTAGSATGYADVDAQTWTVDVTAKGARSSDKVSVAAGGVYSLVAVDTRSGGVRLQAVQDSAASGTMPTGGVDTGGGGLATDRTGEPEHGAALPLSLAAGGGVLLAGSLLASRRAQR